MSFYAIKFFLSHILGSAQVNDANTLVCDTENTRIMTASTNETLTLFYQESPGVHFCDCLIYTTKPEALVSIDVYRKTDSNSDSCNLNTSIKLENKDRLPPSYDYDPFWQFSFYSANSISARGSVLKCDPIDDIFLDFYPFQTFLSVSASVGGAELICTTEHFISDPKLLSADWSDEEFCDVSGRAVEDSPDDVTATTEILENSHEILHTTNSDLFLSKNTFESTRLVSANPDITTVQVTTARESDQSFLDVNGVYIFVSGVVILLFIGATLCIWCLKRQMKRNQVERSLKETNNEVENKDNNDTESIYDEITITNNVYDNIHEDRIGYETLAVSQKTSNSVYSLLQKESLSENRQGNSAAVDDDRYISIQHSRDYLELTNF